MACSSRVAIIGGTGLTNLSHVKEVNRIALETDYGMPSSDLIELDIVGVQTLFLARHGQPHSIPPHLINYRANIAALKNQGVDRIIAVNAVGSIDPVLNSKDIVVPDQIIDYTWGRTPTFFDGQPLPLDHMDFSYPFDETLRNKLIAAAEHNNISIVQHGVYGVTQGPRLETAAEIQRLARDGCTLVGMTLMPEAILAREMGISYASICLVVNPAAGVSNQIITLDDIQKAVDDGMASLQSVLVACLQTL